MVNLPALPPVRMVSHFYETVTLTCHGCGARVYSNTSQDKYDATGLNTAEVQAIRAKLDAESQAKIAEGLAVYASHVNTCASDLAGASVHVTHELTVVPASS